MYKIELAAAVLTGKRIINASLFFYKIELSRAMLLQHYFDIYSNCKGWKNSISDLILVVFWEMLKLYSTKIALQKKLLLFSFFFFFNLPKIQFRIGGMNGSNVCNTGLLFVHEEGILFSQKKQPT